MAYSKEALEQIGFSPFNPIFFEQEAGSKIAVLIDKISKVLRNSMWDKCQKYNITATQGFVLVYLLYSREDRKNISSISEDFKVSKPTISRSVDILTNKGFIEKKVNEKNKRTHVLLLTPRGLEVAQDLSSFAVNIAKVISTTLTRKEKESVLKAFLLLAGNLYDEKMITEFNSCIRCSFLSQDWKSSDSLWCSKLKIFLTIESIRIDCPFFEPVLKRETKRKWKRRKGASKEEI